MAYLVYFGFRMIRVASNGSVKGSELIGFRV